MAPDVPLAVFRPGRRRDREQTGAVGAQLWDGGAAWQCLWQQAVLLGVAEHAIAIEWRLLGMLLLQAACSWVCAVALVVHAWFEAVLLAARSCGCMQQTRAVCCGVGVPASTNAPIRPPVSTSSRRAPRAHVVVVLGTTQVVATPGVGHPGAAL